MAEAERRLNERPELSAEQRSPLIPTLAFTNRLNAVRARDGLPALGILDPLTMLLWHQVTAPPRMSLVLISGC